MPENTTPTAEAVIAKTITANLPTDIGENLSTFIAERVMAALGYAGFVVMAPQDIEWGECPENTFAGEPKGPHRVALNLCAGCLEYDPE